MSVNPFNPNASRYQIKTRHPEGLTPSETANLDSRVTELENYLTSQGNIVQITDDYTLLNGTFIDKVYCKPGINLTLPELSASLGKRFQFIQDYSQASELVQYGDCEDASNLPSFDGDGTFSGSGTIERSSEQAYKGTYSRKITSDGSNNTFYPHDNIAGTTDLHDLDTSGYYQMYLWIYVPTGTDPGHVNLEYSIDGGDFVKNYASKNDEWHRISVLIPAPSTGIRVRLLFDLNADNGDVVYFDEVSLKKIETTTISPQSPDYITHSELPSITLTSEGDYWEVEGSPVYWDLKAGYESIVGSNEGVKRFDATMEQWKDSYAVNSSPNTLTYSEPFLSGTTPSFSGTVLASSRILSIDTSPSPTNEALDVTVTTNSGTVETNRTINWHAIGRWY